MPFRLSQATANIVHYDQAGAMQTTNQNRLCFRSTMKVTTVLIWRATISKLGKLWKHLSMRVSASQLDCPTSIGNCYVLNRLKTTIFRRQVEEVYSNAKKYKPAVLQNESHPYLQEKDLRDFCKLHNIVFQVVSSN